MTGVRHIDWNRPCVTLNGVRYATYDELEAAMFAHILAKQPTRWQRIIGWWRNRL